MFNVFKISATVWRKVQRSSTVCRGCYSRRLGIKLTGRSGMYLVTQNKYSDVACEKEKKMKLEYESRNNKERFIIVCTNYL